MVKTLVAVLLFVSFSPLAFGQITPGSKDLGAIWVIGDSITQGNADADDRSTPRSALFDLLDDNGYTFTFTGHHAVNPEGLLTTGNTTDTNLYQYHSGVSGIQISLMDHQLQSDWVNPNSRLSVVKPNVAMIMLGTNDINNNVDFGRVPPPVNAPGRLKNYVDAIYDQPGIDNLTLFLANIPPIRTTSLNPSRVDAFNAEIPGIVAEQRMLGRDVHFVDMYTSINDDYDNLMRTDNLHPNAMGNVVMATQWFNGVQSVAMVPEPTSSTGMLLAGTLIAMNAMRRQRRRSAGTAREE